MLDSPDQSKITPTADRHSAAMGGRLVGHGLALKLWAMWILFASPLVLGLTWISESNMIVPLGIVLGLALLIDVVGRVTCLIGAYSLPVERLSLLASVLVQCGGIVVALSDLVYGGSKDGVIFVIVVVVSQFGAAYLFTAYLYSLSMYFGRKDMIDLSSGMISAMMFSTVWGMGMSVAVVFTLILCFILFFLLSFLGALGLIVGSYIGSFAVMPLAFLWLASSVRLFTRYRLLVIGLRRAIANGSRES